MTEEERRRKIIIDSQVAATAAAGIGAVMRDELTGEQGRLWIALDEAYLRRAEEIVPGITGGRQ